MGTTNTPLYDLVELSGISANTTYTTAAGGGGAIIGIVDNATYTDTSGLNSATEIIEINDTTDANHGILKIDGVTYNIDIYTPASTNYADRVTITFNGGASTIDLYGDDGQSQIAWIIATPQGGGPTRYFTAIQDDVGNLPDITAIQVRGLDTDPAGDDVKINLDQNNVVTACFASGTRIAVPGGWTAVEALRAGDHVLTMDAGAVDGLSQAHAAGAGAQSAPAAGACACGRIGGATPAAGLAAALPDPEPARSAGASASGSGAASGGGQRPPARCAGGTRRCVSSRLAGRASHPVGGGCRQRKFLSRAGRACRAGRGRPPRGAGAFPGAGRSPRDRCLRPRRPSRADAPCRPDPAPPAPDCFSAMT